MGSAAVQIGTLVKLVRVLMLGPIVAGLSLMMARRADATAGTDHPVEQSASLVHLVPPFILAFLGLAAVNSLGFLPVSIVAQAHQVSGMLTVLAMAGLGLGVDLRSVSAAGPRVACVVILSLLGLGAMAYIALRLTGFA